MDLFPGIQHVIRSPTHPPPTPPRPSSILFPNVPPLSLYHPQGFRKVKNTCWSFANVHFRKGHEEELMNIKRRMGAKGRGEAGSGVGSDGGKGVSLLAVTHYFHETF